MPTRTRKEAEALLLAKAEADPSFRKQLLSDPKAAVSRELGVELPAELKINVVQESDRNIYLVLPPQAPPMGELVDKELDQVAGGLITVSQEKAVVSPLLSGPNELVPAVQVASKLKL